MRKIGDIPSTKIMQFFAEFETERRQVSQTLNDLQSEVIELSTDEDYSDEIALPQIPRDMFEYYMAFSREGASKENIEKRSTIMYQRLTQFLDLG